jgi:5-formyltetrahydrofolate cyclo-ligase
VSGDLFSAKKAARIAAAKKREAAHAGLKGTAGLDLAMRGLPSGLQPGIISGFHPYLSEISVLELLQRLASEGWVTALPVVVGKNEPLILRRWAPGEVLVSGLWGIQIPVDTAPEVSPDVLLVPMLAYDARGYRLGYGGGFYDRTLAKLRLAKKIVAIGVAYAAQETDDVPHDGHDQPMDWIMTEEKTFKCA